MTPQEKAKELVDKMLNSLYDNGSLSFKRILFSKAKQCALISVDEIYNEIDDNFDNLHSSDRKHYWEQVKQEIEKL